MIEADITNLAVDALVSSDDVNGQMRTGAAVAIKAACGEVVEHQSMEQGPHKIGSAWSTEPGRLGVKCVIHVAAVNTTGTSSLEIIKTATMSAILFAQEYRLNSMALPIMGAGTARIQYDECVETLVRACHEHLRASAGSLPRDIVLVLFSPPSFEKSIARARDAVSDGIGTASA